MFCFVLFFLLLLAGFHASYDAFTERIKLGFSFWRHQKEHKCVKMHEQINKPKHLFHKRLCLCGNETGVLGPGLSAKI